MTVADRGSGDELEFAEKLRTHDHRKWSATISPTFFSMGKALNESPAALNTFGLRVNLSHRTSKAAFLGLSAQGTGSAERPVWIIELGIDYLLPVDQLDRLYFGIGALLVRGDSHSWDRQWGPGAQASIGMDFAVSPINCVALELSTGFAIFEANRRRGGLVPAISSAHTQTVVYGLENVAIWAALSAGYRFAL